MTGENLATRDVFADRELLAPEYVPRERLVGREEELANVEYALNPMIFGREPDSVLVRGPRGVGKTACARYSARRQTRYAREQGLAAGWAAVDCLHRTTEAGVARAVATRLDDAGTGVAVPDSGLSTAEYRDRLGAVLEAAHDAAVVILDRVDHLKGDRLVEWLGPGAEGPSTVVSVIGIVDGDATHRVLGGTEQWFDPYDVDRLTDILERRRDAFVEDALAAGTPERAARVGAAAGGDAGRAIAALRLAGERVAGREGSVVRPADVDAVAGAVEHVRVRDRLKAVGTHSQLTLLALASLASAGDGRPFRTRRVHEAYAEHCRERGHSPRSGRRVLDFLDEHERLGLTEQSTHWGGRADGNYKTHRLRPSPDAVLAAVESSPA